MRGKVRESSEGKKFKEEKKGNFDSWTLRECLCVQKERGYNEVME